MTTKPYKIILVDDGSTDKTKDVIAKFAQKYPITLIGYSKNKGPGYAFNLGFNYLIPKLHKNDIVITMETDNTCDFSVLNRMILKCKNFDVVLSSPYANGGKFLGLGKDRIILGLGANILDRLIFRIKDVKTYASFYRTFRAEILKKLREKYNNKIITDEGFSAVVEMLVKLNKIKAKIAEIPATVDWRKKRGISKMKISTTILRHLLIYKNYLSGKFD